MTKKFSLPRGTADILPAETPLWQNIESKARKIFQIYGYKEIRTPIFEETALFTRSLGETSDVVQKQMLSLEKEGLALRPEGTASVVRAYLQAGLDKKESLTKLFYIGPMFRGERPQKGRLRQFHQIGVEIIGPNSSDPMLDVEVIRLSAHLLDEFGVKGYKIKINSLGKREDKAKLSLILKDALNKNLNELCNDCKDRLERNVFRILDCKNEQCRKVVKKINIGESHLSDASKNYFVGVKKGLAPLKDLVEVSPYLVRGLDYYTDIVFEISHESLGSQDALGAGGRYNTLLQDLGGSPELGGLGFALGVERILLACAKSETKLEPFLDVFVVCAGNPNETNGHIYLKAYEYLNLLRKNSISSDMIYTRTTTTPKQMSAAGKKAKFALIIGQNEFQNHTVKLKDLKAQKEESIQESQIIEKLKEKLC